MMAKWCRAATNYSRVISQRNNLLSSHLCASSCLNYSKVASVAEPAVADPLEKSHFSKTEVNLNKMFWSKPHSLALPPDLPLRIEEPEYEGIKRFILKLMLFYSKQSKSIRGANVIYRQVIAEVDKPPIYNGLSFTRQSMTV